MRTTWRNGLGLLLAATAGAGCAEGIEPPSPTKMVEVRSGLTFTFGNDQFCDPPQTAGSQIQNCSVPTGNIAQLWPEIEVTIPAFAIDEHEVTNFQYEYCVAAGACQPPGGVNAISEEQKDYYENPRFRQFPVVRVSWDMARDYCAFVGRRLPTELEWERVARGNPNEGIDRKYPVEGDLTDVTECQASGGLGFNVNYCNSGNNLVKVASSDRDFVTENGSKIYDLFGNVSEWTDTWLAHDMTCKDDPPCTRERDCQVGDNECITAAKSCPACDSTDCYFMCDEQPLKTIICVPFSEGEQPVAAADILPDGGDNKVIRGGSVSTNRSQACRLMSTRPTDRGGIVAQPTTMDTQGNIGFRCAKSL